MRAFATAFLSVLFVCCNGSALAQQNLVGERALAFLEGSWAGKVKYFTPQGAQPIEMDATLKVVSTLKSHYLKIEESMLVPGSPDETLSMLTFNNITNQFQLWKFDSHSPGPKMLMGDLQASKDKDSGVIHKKAVFSSPVIAGNDGESLAYRETLSWDDFNSFKLLFETRIGGTWKSIYTVDFERKK